VLEVLGRFNLRDKKDEKVSNLSRGERFLTMLSRATVADQPLLLVDEPLAGIDAGMRRMVQELLEQVSVNGRSMLILATGQIELDIPGAARYQLSQGRLQ